MITVADIKKAIEALPEKELSLLSFWFKSFEEKRCDKQIKNDDKHGLLYDLMKEAKAEYNAISYTDIITVEAGKRCGKPCIRGMRITVADVLGYLASGMSVSDILQDFPELVLEDIKACLAYAADREKKLMIATA